MSLNPCLPLIQLKKLARPNSSDVQKTLDVFDDGVWESEFETVSRILLEDPDYNDGYLFLELVLAGASYSENLANWLLENFPRNAGRFSSSVSAKVLERLSLFLLFVPNHFDREAVQSLTSHRKLVELSPPILRYISSTFHKDVLGVMEGKAGDLVDEEYEGPRGKRKKSTQKDRKWSKNARFNENSASLNAKAFASLGHKVPTDAQEAESLELLILTELKSTLKFYVDTMCSHEILSCIMDTFTKQHLAEEEGEGSRDINVDADGTPAEVSGIPAAYPMVQPMKAALYFDSAIGFGEWHILISTRAESHLREARRKDAKFFKIIMKKIKELSNGHFSDDNMKRLNNNLSNEVPIYEAKMTRDSRIIYQVDCIPEYDIKAERQVLKIFGIYNHAQIARLPLDSMGLVLGRNGKEYRRRCTFRNPPHHPGDNVVLPATFPPVEKVEEVVSAAAELPKEDLEEIHSLLVLEKYVTLSQVLLNSILADLDVSHVFNVTPQEKEIIEHPFSCYVLGRSGTGKTTTMLFKILGIERAYELQGDDLQKPRQLFVTQSPVLAAKVEEYFSKLTSSLLSAEKTPREMAEIATKIKQQREEKALIAEDDKQNWRADLPSKFSLLEKKHFPLFLTFDQLAKLLEADVAETHPALLNFRAPLLQETANSAVEGSSANLINYDVFLRSYWPHFSQSLTKGLDPSLVFSEFIGVIQGSEDSLQSSTRYLEKSAYERLSFRAQYTFASQRDVLYTLFQAYLKRKRSRKDYDAADRTHALLKAFEMAGVPGQKIDYLYVDEAQDNLLIDALLLRSLCRNPDGLFWAGDTAQTISVGSSFRFDDLKAFLFRLEERKNAANKGVIPYGEPPRSFQLVINYRSHGGIVDCAHSVIELITHFWPHAIDVLARERGVVDGCKPVFFSGWDKETVRYEQFLFGTSNTQIEFGAQQCILVRDEAARNELREQVGEIGIIMTLYESKGLEFDDVLLYKFFEDSTVDISQWRVVLNHLKERIKSDIPAPRFDEIRHAGVCSELKFLYVAITRARKNLWIVDCSATGEPMRMFWSHRDQIQNCTPGTDVPRLAVSSSPDEWEKTGRTLFQHKRYLQAMYSFQRAGLRREEIVAHAYFLREKARTLPATTLVEQENIFLEVADAFIQCASMTEIQREKHAYYYNSGECFERANAYAKAAETYVKATEFNTAVKLYRKCGLFDEAVKIVLAHREDMNAKIADDLIDVARLFYFQEKKFSEASQLFSSVEEELEYLADFDLDDSRALVLEEMHRYKDAAEIHFTEGRSLEAIQLLLKDSEDSEAISRARDYILHGLWSNMTFGLPALEGEKVTVVLQLLMHASNLEKSTVDPSTINELLMFQAINDQNREALRNLGHIFDSEKDIPSALLCFDHYFSVFPAIRVLDSHQISSILVDFRSYIRFLQDLLHMPNGCTIPKVQKLFGIRPYTANVFLLPEGTYLHRMVSKHTAILGASEAGVTVSEEQLSLHLSHCLLNRLQMRVTEENNKCYDAQAFTPCVHHAILSGCNRVNCPHKHFDRVSLSPAWYNMQVRIHLQQIDIYNQLHYVYLDVQERWRGHTYWLSRLHETLYPVTYLLGTMLALDLGVIPEATTAVAAVKFWSQEMMYSNRRINPRNDHKLLTLIYRVTHLCTLFDKSNVWRYLQQSPVLYHFNHFPEYLRDIKGEAHLCVVPELVHSLQGSGEACIAMGILFIKQILLKHIPIDITVLCDFLDYICGSIILVINQKLNGVTLPRSWLVSLIQQKQDAKYVPMGLIYVLLEQIGQLLESLHSGLYLEQLLFETSNLSRVVAVRNIFISRICRTAVLLGYNWNNYSLRQEILQHLTPIRTGRSHPLYRSYSDAQHWNSLAFAVRKSMMGSPMDEMIQIFEESKNPGPNYRIKGIRVIVFNAMEDLPQLLRSNVSITPLPDHNLEAPISIPNALAIQEDSAVELLENESSQDAEALQVTEDPEGLAPNAGAESIADTIILNNNIPPSAEQNRAANTFAVLYRRVLTRRRLSAGKTTEQMLLRSFFEACLTASRSMDWPYRYYKMLFLGPIPHVLVCIAAIQAYLHAAKAKTKKLFKEAKHQALEEVSLRMTEMRRNFKEAQRLQKALSPQSELHHKRDLETLKKLVLDVEALMNSVQGAATPQIQTHLQLALRGIVAVALPPKSKPKPILCIDDDDERYEHGLEYEDDVGYGSEDLKREEAPISSPNISRTYGESLQAIESNDILTYIVLKAGSVQGDQQLLTVV